jgi:uridine phosphorylase
VTGRKDGKRWSIISTGIGTDNIDIVFNELDALVNIDLQSRQIKEHHTRLRFYRLGTSGTLQGDIPVDSFIVTALAVGLGGLLLYYKDGAKYMNHPLSKEVQGKLLEKGIQIPAYICPASPNLLERVRGKFIPGITYTAPGFYGPQGRSLRLTAQSKDYLDHLSSISYEGLSSTNLEMETAGIYGIAGMLGHEAISLNLILANRISGAFTSRAGEAMEEMIALFFNLFSDK